eukprot:jgi/Galph1/4930/GphlegSOOS_G3511.1
MTDYLEEERERGITINAAAVSLEWKHYQINLIDTPGHIDFTMEVERSLRVLDGGVVILDAVAGVQAQTESVWKQAARYSLPLIVFVNKMDRIGANFLKAAWSLQRLNAAPVILQLPVIRRDQFEGVIDLITMRAITYADDLGKDEISVSWGSWKQVFDSELDINHLEEQALHERKIMLDTLADQDDTFTECYLQHLDEDKPLAEEDIRQALRRVTINRKLVPVLCGAALRNRGVQSLLDAVVYYLPSPLDRPPILGINSQGEMIRKERNLEGSFLAFAFKVVHDIHRGPLVYIRVFSGRKEVKTPIRNVNRKVKEIPSQYLLISADDISVLVPEVKAGGVYAVMGLKETVSGDTLVDSNDNNATLLQGLHVPQPVFYTSIEPESSKYEKALEEALKMLQREDPSLALRVDEPLAKPYLEVPVIMGAPMVAFVETITETIEHHCIYDKHIGGQHLFAEVTLKMEPLGRGEGISFSVSPKLRKQLLSEYALKEHEVNTELNRHKTLNRDTYKGARNMEQSPLEAVISGFENSLARGPLMDSRVVDIRVTLLEMNSQRMESNSLTSLRACAVNAIQEALVKANPRLLEPVMKVVIAVPNQYVGTVIADITGPTRRGMIMTLDTEEEAFNHFNEKTLQKVIVARVPLKSMLGYSTDLRTITHGSASFTMELLGYDFPSVTAETEFRKEYGFMSVVETRK